MNVVSKPTAHELVLTRDLAAPRAKVFAAWTDVRLASRWWAPQNFMPLSCEMDVRPGMSRIGMPPILTAGGAEGSAVLRWSSQKHSRKFAQGAPIAAHEHRV